MIHRVTIEGQYLGQVINNVLAFDDKIAGGVSTTADEETLAGAACDAWIATVLLFQAPQYVLTGATSRSIEAAPAIGVVSRSAAGGQVAEPYSGAVCAAVVIPTALRGRSFRGRTGIAGVTEAQVQGNELAADVRGFFETQFRNFVNRMLDGAGPPVRPSYQLGVLSEFSGKVKRPAPIFTPATQTSVKARLGTRVSRIR